MYPCLSKCASLWNSFCKQPNPFKKKPLIKNLHIAGGEKHIAQKNGIWQKTYLGP